MPHQNELILGVRYNIYTYIIYIYIYVYICIKINIYIVYEIYDIYL